MTQQHNWYIGMPVIMTADSGKGKVWVDFNGINIKDGEYEGKVICGRGEYPIMIELKNGRLGSFNRDGNAPTHPGMSIRPAENLTDHCGKCNERVTGETRHVCPTPSQWIEGQIPDDYRGWLWIWHHLYTDPETAKLVYSGDTVQVKRERYSHWMPAELPPPPPVKEVEAYGYLRWSHEFAKKRNMIGRIVTDVQEYIRMEDVARAFYFAPATSENIGKYLRNAGAAEPSSTLNKYIENDNTLLFTPAALKELGVK